MLKKINLAALCLASLATLFSTTVHAGWMQSFTAQPLNQLFIPGSHDAGAYKAAVTETFSPDNSIPWEGKPAVHAIQNWAISQNWSIADQAKNGIRYFDIRLCSDGKSVAVCHGVYFESLDDLLRQIADYLVSADGKSEVVIIDINGFHNFDAQAHARAVASIRADLGARNTWGGVAPNLLANPSRLSFQSSVGQFVSAGTRVIVLYDDQSTQIHNGDILWSSQLTYSPWAKAVTAAQLESYYTSTYASFPAPKGNQLYIRAFHATPDAATIVLWDALHPMSAAYSLGTSSGATASLQGWTDGYGNSAGEWLAGQTGTRVVTNSAAVPTDFVDTPFNSGMTIMALALTRNMQRYNSAELLAPFAKMGTSGGSIYAILMNALSSFFK